MKKCLKINIWRIFSPKFTNCPNRIKVKGDWIRKYKGNFISCKKWQGPTNAAFEKIEDELKDIGKDKKKQEALIKAHILQGRLVLSSIEKDTTIKVKNENGKLKAKDTDSHATVKYFEEWGDVTYFPRRHKEQYDLLETQTTGEEHPGMSGKFQEAEEKARE